MNSNSQKSILIQRWYSGFAVTSLILTALLGCPDVLAQAPSINQAEEARVIAPPVFTPRDVPETFFGTLVPDPYRALEDKASPTVNAWMHAHDKYARALLERIPGRTKLFDRLVKFDSSVPAKVTGVLRTLGDIWFYERRGVDDNQFKLYRRRGLQGSEHILVDPEIETRRTGEPHAISYYFASADGRVLAYGLSAQGSENSSLHLLDTSSGVELGSPISRTDFGGVSFSVDGRQFVFNRLRAVHQKIQDTEKYQHSQVLLMSVGAPLSSAKVIFGFGVPGVEIAPAAVPFVSLTADGRWALGQIVNGTQNEFGLYVSTAKALLAGKPKWVRLFDSSDKIVGFAYHDDALYLRTHAQAPRYRLLKLNLAKLDLSLKSEVRRALKVMPVVVPESDQIITEHVAAADALYVARRDGNVKRLFRLDYTSNEGEGATLQEVVLPVLGNFDLTGEESGVAAATPMLPGLVFELQGWTLARQIYEVNSQGQIINTKLQPVGPDVSPVDLVATEVKVSSHDGTLVPMSILHRKDLVRDGRNPTMIWGYGAYGITESPTFSTNLLAFLDAGGIVAVVNPRGSGVYGEGWYRGGFQASKPNTWRDVIACAEWLIDKKYSSPEKLGLRGGSAGGVLVGRAITERPDLFSVAVVAAGTLDMIRAETTPIGVQNIPEFGSRKNKTGFTALFEMSTYHHIRDGVKYPAIMFTHGVNDPRVEVWQSMKAAARMAAATKSGKPVLLRLDWNAGHGAGSTKQQEMAERADVYAFMLWQMGVQGYQPE